MRVSSFSNVPFIPPIAPQAVPPQTPCAPPAPAAFLPFSAQAFDQARLRDVPVLLFICDAPPSFADAGASRWVFVVEPASLTLRITPANESDTNSLIAIGSKVLIQGQPYRFDVEMFDADLHKIDVTSHTVFDLSFDTKFFDEQSHSANH